MDTRDLKIELLTILAGECKKHPAYRALRPGTGRNFAMGAQMIKVVGSTFAFPKYCSEAKYNANSAIAALNKWLKPRVLDGCVIHSFRHTLRNCFRAIECPADIIDTIGSWTTKSVGHQYCQEHRITITHGCMKMLKATI